MIGLILNEEHLTGALDEALQRCRHRLFIVTANVKDVYLPVADSRTGRGRGRARSILDVFDELARRHVQVHLLHGGVPSGPFLARLKEGVPATLTMRRCPRVHAKAVIVDGRWMYLGSANLTGAGLGAKSARRRNFEAGIWTDQTDLIDPVLDMLEEVWQGSVCPHCGRKDFCPEPLEEPRL
jgi:phosphatidylserine/phosphatidylglycerophosphate/cardiolipin synthase-like enzyme